MIASTFKSGIDRFTKRKSATLKARFWKTKQPIYHVIENKNTTLTFIESETVLEQQNWTIILTDSTTEKFLNFAHIASFYTEVYLGTSF